MASDELAEAKIYCTCMEEIKTRLYLLAAFFKGKGTGSEVTDGEFGCLQFRKVLELIALASIAMVWQTHDWFAWMIMTGAQVPCALGWSVLTYTKTLAHENHSKPE